MTTTETRSVRPLAKLTDDDLMVRIETDVDQCLAEIWARYGDRLMHSVQRIVHDRHLAEEVCQDVIAKVFFKCHLYRPCGSFFAWLSEIARNQAYSALRRRRHVPEPLSSFAQQDGDEIDVVAQAGVTLQDRGLEERELLAKLQVAVAQLPERYREVFELCVQNGMAYGAAARLLDIPPGTVAIRIMRARKRLFAALEHHFDRIRRPPACLVN